MKPSYPGLDTGLKVGMHPGEPHQGAEASNMVPIFRVKENKEHYICNAIEAGAQGIVIPHIATKEDA